MRLLMLTLSVVLFAAGCDDVEIEAGAAEPPPPPAAKSQPVPTYDFSHKVLSSPEVPVARKWPVAILRFADDRSVEDVPWGPPEEAADSQVSMKVNVGSVDLAQPQQPAAPQMNKRAREVLKHQLVSSGAFNVIERERILEILREINFGKTDYADPATSPDKGQLLCVRYLIEGSIGVNEDMTLKGYLEKDADYKDAAANQAGLWDNVFKQGRVNREQLAIAMRKLQQQQAKERARDLAAVACYLSIYDVHSGQIAATVVGLGENALEAIREAVEELTQSLSELDGGIRVAAVVGDKVYIDVGAQAGIGVGGRYKLLRNNTPIRDRDGQVIGYDRSELAEIEIVDVQPAMSIGRIVASTAEPARGDTVVPLASTGHSPTEN